MKLLSEASVSFQMHETDDGKIVVTASILSDEITPESTSASAAAIFAATAYGLFQNGHLAVAAKDLFDIDMETANAA